MMEETKPALPVIHLYVYPNGRVTRWVVSVPPHGEHHKEVIGVKSQKDGNLVALKIAKDRFGNQALIKTPHSKEVR